MKLLRKLEESFEEWILGILLVCMSVILLVQILMRIFGVSLTWAEEIARYFYVWSVFLSVSYTIRKGNALVVELVLNSLPRASRRIMTIMLDVINVAVWALLAYYSVKNVERVYSIGQTSPAMAVPMYLVYAIIPVGFGLASIRSAQRLYFDITGKLQKAPQDSAKTA